MSDRDCRCGVVGGQDIPHSCALVQPPHDEQLTAAAELELLKEAHAYVHKAHKDNLAFLSTVVAERDTLRANVELLKNEQWERAKEMAQLRAEVEQLQVSVIHETTKAERYETMARQLTSERDRARDVLREVRRTLWDLSEAPCRGDIVEIVARIDAAFAGKEGM